MTTTTTTPTIAALKTARGRKTGAVIQRTATRMTTTTTDGDVWVTIASPDDGGAEGYEVFQPGNVADAPTMSDRRTFAAALNWRQVEQIVGAVVPATDTETSRYALGGTLIDCREGSMLAVVATDGRRLHAAHLQPSSIAGETPDHCVVPADAWSRLATVTRAAVKAVRGLAGKALAADLLRGAVTVETDGTVVRLVWGQGDLTVTVTTRLIQGRFPRWRDIVGPATADVGGIVVDVDTMAAEVAEFSRRHRAEVATAKAAWTAAAAVAKQQRRYHAPFAHDRGLWVGPDGMEGRGAAFVNKVRSAPARVCLDHAFLADALAAVELFSPSSTAVVQATDASSAVVIGKGVEAGERVVAVMMPLAID
jgi:hypothetical protein